MQPSKILQSGRIFGKLLGPLLKLGLPLVKNVLTLLAKIVPLALTTAASAAVEGIHRKSGRSGTSSSETTLIISTDEKNDIMRIVKFLKDLGLLMKGVTQTNDNKMKEESGVFLDTLDANILGNMITGKVVNRAGN